VGGATGANDPAPTGKRLGFFPKSKVHKKKGHFFFAKKSGLNVPSPLFVDDRKK